MVASVTLRPLVNRDLPSLSKGFMWPWAENATNRTWISGLISVSSEDMVGWRIVWIMKSEGSEFGSD